MTKIASGAMSALSSLFLLAGVPLSAEAAGAFSQIYAFTGGADGAYPDSAVTFDAAGNMYGQTGGGGNVCADGQSGAFNYGCGTLYKISPTGQLTTLVTFTGANGYGGGGKPAIVNGKLYASTIGGGASNLGVIFSVNTDGTGFQLIHQFSGKDGANPIGPLIPSSDGGLYGIAYYGGYYRSQSGLGNGILFKINRNGSYMPIHEFRGKGGNDGSEPVALLIDGSGTLYGSTLIGGVDCYSQGCGTIFSYVPSTGAFTNLFELSNVHKGASNPYLGSVDPKGNLYAAAESGGKYGQGTLFELSLSDGTYSPTTLHDFGSGKGPDGNNPSSGPTWLPDNTLIGQTSNTLYFFDPTQPFYGNIVQTFQYGTYQFQGQPIVGPGAAVYGSDERGGLTTNCVLANGTVLPGPGCGFIYREARPGAPQ